MIYIYLPNSGPRSRYIFKLIFSHYFGIKEYKLIADKEDANRAVDEGLHFYASPLLEERGIKDIEIRLAEHQGVKTLFAHQNSSALPYDPFAASFYMLSRYEEYLPHRRDQYDRFIAEDSIAFQEGFMSVAVVDRWLIQLKQILQAKFPELSFLERKYHYQLTLDIDNAYAFQNKGFLRNFGAAVRSILKGNFEQLALQFKVITSQQKDPFDSYNYLKNVQKRYHLKPIYFFLLADYGLNDKNISHQNRKFQSLIKTISDYAEVAIHPSFGSNYNHSKLSDEISRLERITKREVKKSRQHFLKLHLPDTYRNLVEEDIVEDYTMGYASALGFRAGAAFPYPYYDLDEEVELKLLVYPFMVMDATLKYYLNVEGDEALEQIKKIIDEVKAVDGTFVSLWHNESLGENQQWKGWKDLFEKMNEYALNEA